MVALMKGMVVLCGGKTDYVSNAHHAWGSWAATNSLVSS